MCRFWWKKDKVGTFTKVRVEYTVDAAFAEHIVASTYTEITSKKALKQAMQNYLRDNGWELNSESISDVQSEVDSAYEKARLVVKRFMPQLYAAAN